MPVMDPMQSGESGADGEAEHAMLSRRDLRQLAIIASARFDDPALEARRVALLRDVNRASRAASRRFGEYTRHTVSESSGSRRAWNVTDDAQEFFTALAEYCAAVRRGSGELEELAMRWRESGGEGDAVR